MPYITLTIRGKPQVMTYFGILTVNKCDPVKGKIKYPFWGRMTIAAYY